VEREVRDRWREKRGIGGERRKEIGGERREVYK